MKLNELLEFRKDLYFDGAVQIDWFYSKEKSKKVAENFVFHGSEYFGIGNLGSNKRIDTIGLVEQLSYKLNDETSKPLSLAIADYGTGKSHLAVTLGVLLSGPDYMPETFDNIIGNIKKISQESAAKIEKNCSKRNLVMVINGMRDFNLHSELLKSAEKSLNLYGISDEKLRKINRAVETAELFFSRNSTSLLTNFENAAKKRGWYEIGNALLEKIKNNLLIDNEAFEIINEVYELINGHQIRWDEGISATVILNQLISEYCGISGVFDSVVLLFDEFGRYLEYASGEESAKTGDSALQQIFECSQNAEGLLHVINFIQSDIKSYLQRVDNTKNISRYIGRYDVSDKYYISSNLETVFANLIQRKNISAFNNLVVEKQKSQEEYWEKMFFDINRWKNLNGVWNDYPKFRKVIVEGTYPMHPISTLMLTQLSDYLQNRSSLTMISQYIQNNENADIDDYFSLLPEELMKGDLFTEMLTSEQEGKQTSQHCILYSNILSKYEDKLSEKTLKVLRANLIIRILRFKNSSLDDVKCALSYCCGLSLDEIDDELAILVDEYGILGYDDRANCFDFMEESNGAHDYKIIKKRLLSRETYNHLILQNIDIREFAGLEKNIETSFGNQKHSSTKEWEYKQDLYDISEFNSEMAEKYISEWKKAISANTPKGRLIWLYSNKYSNPLQIEHVNKLVRMFEGMPIVVMLLNDTDNRLYNDLLEYIVLRNLDDQIKEKFKRHYEDDIQQNIDRLSVDFSNLKKDRLFFNGKQVEPFNDRLMKSLTSKFDEIYPNIISFPFDGYVSAKYNISKNQAKIYITILKALLSGQVNDNLIHDWPSETRNRFIAMFGISARNSWKCLNDQSNIIPPEEPNVRKVYDMIASSLESDSMIDCSKIVEILTMPPYGINYDAIVVLVCLVLCNLNYCTRLLYNGELYSVKSWRDLLLIKDDKIKTEVFDKTILKHVDTGEISNKFISIFRQIEGNKNPEIITNLMNLLDTTKKENELPVDLEASYNYCLKVLNDGFAARKDFKDLMSKIEEEDSKATPVNLYPALKAYSLLLTTDFSGTFIKYNYEYSAEYKDRVEDKMYNISDYIDQNFDTFLGTVRCKDIEHKITFRNNAKKTIDLFKECGFDEYARIVNERYQSEIDNMELVESRAKLVSDYNDFYSKCRINRYTSFAVLKDYEKDCNGLIGRFNQFRTTLKDSDAVRIKKGLIEKQSEIKTELDSAEDEISSIFDDSSEIENILDIDRLITRISNLLRRGLNEKNEEEFISLQEELQTLKEDLKHIDESLDSREDFNRLEEELENRYKNYDSDLLNEDTIFKFLDIAKDKMDIKELEWMEQYCTLGDKSNSAIYVWKQAISNLPRYLTADSIKKIKDLDKEAEMIQKQRRIETVIQYFTSLNSEERNICFDEIKKIINR